MTRTWILLAVLAAAGWLAGAWAYAGQAGAPEAKPEVKAEAKPEAKPEVKPEAKPATAAEVKPEAKPQVKPETKPEAQPAPLPAELNELAARVSYVIGYNLALQTRDQIKSQIKVQIDPAMLGRGYADAFGGKDSQLSKEHVAATLAEVREIPRKAGAAFLVENGKKEGVVTTKSGLQYKVVKAGEGKVTPQAESSVDVHYEGKLLDGTVFDSSHRRGRPATFKVNQVIAGWIEALQLMKEGDHWTLYIPSELAYGERGSPPAIGPHETLVFDVQLLKIAK